MAATQIAVERRGRIEIITMWRPDHGNRVTQAMAQELIAALEVARQSPDVSACVLTGHGDVFCLDGITGARVRRACGGLNSPVPS